MNVVTDKVSRHAIDRAKEENRIVRIDRVMAEVEVTDFDSICQKEKTGDEGFHLERIIALFEQFFGILSRNVFSDEPAELTIRPAIENVLIRTERICRAIGCQYDVAIENDRERLAT